jgi:hypothetical protein
LSIFSDNEPAEESGKISCASDTVAGVPMPASIETVLSAQDRNVSSAPTHYEADRVDVEDLLESDNSDSSSEEAGSGHTSCPTFVKEEIVWELWHPNNEHPIAVSDEELLTNMVGVPGQQFVMAQLAMVTSVHRVKKQGLMLGLLTLTDGMEETFSLDQPCHLVAAKSVRKFGTYVQDRMILHSQQSAGHFVILKSIFEDVESYTYLHRNLQPGVSGLLTVGQFFSLDSQFRRSYISRMSSRTLQQLPAPLVRQDTAPSPDAASAFEYMENTALSSKSHEAYSVLPEDTICKQPDIVNRQLSPAILEMVHHLPATWPMDWVTDPAETIRLQQIAAAASDVNPQVLLRHNLFFDPKEREFRQGRMSGLIEFANPTFRTIFEATGGRLGGQESAAEIDMKVQAVLLRILMEQHKQGKLERRLRRMFRAAFSPQVTIFFSSCHYLASKNVTVTAV